MCRCVPTFSSVKFKLAPIFPPCGTCFAVFAFDLLVFFWRLCASFRYTFYSIIIIQTFCCWPLFIGVLRSGVYVFFDTRLLLTCGQVYFRREPLHTRSSIGSHRTCIHSLPIPIICSTFLLFKQPHIIGECMRLYALFSF